jgi:hypothetical protein
MNTDVKLAFDTIMGKREKLADAFRYYDGNQPLVYANERLREVFAGVQVRFLENWCAVVIDACKERLQLNGVTAPDAVQEVVQAIWDTNQLGLESDDLHEAALVTGEAYLVVWPDENGAPEMFYNDPRLCHVFYRGDNPRAVRYAAKLWVDEDGGYRLTLYYADRLEYYRTVQKASAVGDASAFVVDDDEFADGMAANPFGEVPVFHFCLSRRGTLPKGDLENVIPIQNGINKLLTDMMVAAEYGAFRQRWIISNADVGALKNSPNEIWSVPGGDGMGQSTQVGEFQATDLGNYLNAIDQLASAVAKITRTPKHYLYAQGGDPSGEALIAMESPLTRKAEARIERFTAVWRRAMVFALKVAGLTVDVGDVVLKWDKVGTVQPMTQAQVRLLDVQAGIPLVTVLRREGWSEAEIETMQGEMETSGEQLGDAILGKFDKGQ